MENGEKVTLMQICQDAQYVGGRVARQLFLHGTLSSVDETGLTWLLFTHDDVQGKFVDKYMSDDPGNRSLFKHGYWIILYNLDELAKMSQQDDADVEGLLASFIDGQFEFHMYDVGTNSIRSLTAQERANFSNKRMRLLDDGNGSKTGHGKNFKIDGWEIVDN